MRVRKSTVFVFIEVILLFLVFGAPSHALSLPKERITGFSSYIRVHTDGSLTVTEEIKVISAHISIKRGIVRDFPTKYKDRYGGRIKVSFKVLEVLREGRPEPYHIKSAKNGKRVFIGRQDVFLRPGAHTYAITYKTDRQLGFFKDFDELYWNVTGNGWTFLIERAEAIVELPPGATIIQHTGYTGPYGSRGQEFTAASDREGLMTFAATRPLKPGEGLTIVVAWPKGIVAAPTSLDMLGYFVKDHPSLSASMGGFVLLLFYYLFFWYREGRDPKKGTIIPHFFPPQGFSPASIRIIKRMGYKGMGNKTFAVALVNMAVKGFLKIEEESGNVYKVTKTGADDAMLSKWERKVALKLFGRDSSIVLKNDNHEKISKAREVLLNGLMKDLEHNYFILNRGYLGRGLLLTLFVAASVFAFGITIPAVVVFVLLIVINIVFYHLLKSPTFAGRKIMDEIEGFKVYLSIAEEERLNLLNPPEKTPELFEKYLPYAMALDVENEWSERFTDVLSKADLQKTYHPDWYAGDRPFRDLGPALGSSFSSAISSSSSAPGSSSGFSSSSSGGGGGSSGGGGGGGGGSGW